MHISKKQVTDSKLKQEKHSQFLSPGVCQQMLSWISSGISLWHPKQGVTTYMTEAQKNIKNASSLQFFLGPCGIADTFEDPMKHIVLSALRLQMTRKLCHEVLCRVCPYQKYPKISMPNFGSWGEAVNMPIGEAVRTFTLNPKVSDLIRRSHPHWASDSPGLVDKVGSPHSKRTLIKHFNNGTNSKDTSDSPLWGATCRIALGWGRPCRCCVFQSTASSPSVSPLRFSHLARRASHIWWVWQNRCESQANSFSTYWKCNGSLRTVEKDQLSQRLETSITCLRLNSRALDFLGGLRFWGEWVLGK